MPQTLGLGGSGPKPFERACIREGPEKRFSGLKRLQRGRKSGGLAMQKLAGLPQGGFGVITDRDNRLHRSHGRQCQLIRMNCDEEGLHEFLRKSQRCRPPIGGEEMMGLIYYQPMGPSCPRPKFLEPRQQRQEKPRSVL